MDLFNIAVGLLCSSLCFLTLVYFNAHLIFFVLFYAISYDFF